MENPQKENGYTPIANEIMEALARTKFNTQESRIIFAILRKTYGYNKKNDWISNSQLEQITGIHRVHCSHTVTKLLLRKIVARIGNKIQFNKLYSQWSQLPKQATKQAMPKQAIRGCLNRPHPLPKQATTIIDNTKDNITKDNIAGKPAESNNINILLKEFEPINPTINYGNKTERQAIQDLLKQFGHEKLLNTIKFAVSIQGQQYAPVITTPYQLKQNMGKLLIYYRRESTPKKGGITVL